MAGLQPPGPGEQYATATVAPTLETISEFLKSPHSNREYHGSSHSRVGDLRALETCYNLRPGGYEIQWTPSGGRAIGVQPAGTRAPRDYRRTDQYEMFRDALRPPQDGEQYATPGVPLDHVIVSQWLTVDGTRTFHGPSRITEGDLVAFITEHKLRPGYHLRRDRRVKGVGFGDVNGRRTVETGLGHHTTDDRWKNTVEEARHELEARAAGYTSVPFGFGPPPLLSAAATDTSRRERPTTASAGSPPAGRQMPQARHQPEREWRATLTHARVEVERAHAAARQTYDGFLGQVPSRPSSPARPDASTYGTTDSPQPYNTYSSAAHSRSLTAATHKRPRHQPSDPNNPPRHPSPPRGWTSTTGQNSQGRGQTQ